MSSYVTNEALQRFKDNLDNDSAILDLKFMKLVTKMGLASDFYSIGDEIVVDYTYEGTTYDFSWIIVDFKNVVKEDGKSHPAIILQSKYSTIESIQFDNAEPNNPNPSIQSNGYNRYKYSASRQWLNSDAQKGQWWSATSATDVAPNQLASYSGFMAGFDQKIISIIEPVEIKTKANTALDDGIIDTVYDKFWLPSIEEMYGVPEASVNDEGTYHPYWKELLGLTNPSNNSNNSRKIATLLDKSTVYNIRLRSAKLLTTATAYSLKSSGEISTGVASTPYKLLVDCAIS